jgi:hypothetical protein
MRIQHRRALREQRLAARELGGISVVSSPINHAFTLIGEAAAKLAAAEVAGCEPIELSM